YLQRLLKDFIENIMNGPEMDLEVDPSRLPTKAVVSPSSSGPTGKWAVAGTQLYDNQVALLNAFSQVWSAIQNSLEYFPRALQETFGILRKYIERDYPADTADRLLSSCLFLRFICPAILGPMLFGLTNSLSDDPKVTRNLTLVAKALQTLANLARFEEKEFYMRFLNDFVCGQHEEMRRFLRVISMPPPPKRADVDTLLDNREHHQFIHINYEFARIHTLLCDILKDQNEVPGQLQRLPGILDAVSGMLSNGTLDLKSSQSSLSQAVEAEQPKCTLNGISENEDFEVIYCNDSALQKMRDQNQFQAATKLHSNTRWPSGPELSKALTNGILLEPKQQNKEHVLRIGSLPTTPQKKKLSGAFRACSMRQNSIPHSSGDEYFSPSTATNSNNNGSTSIPGPRMGTRAIQLSRERLHVSSDVSLHILLEEFTFVKKINSAIFPSGSPSLVTRSNNNNEATDVNSLHSILQRQEIRMLQAETRLSECNSEIARLHAHIDELQRLNSQPRTTIDGSSQLSDSDQFSTSSQSSLNRHSLSFWNCPSSPSHPLHRRLDELQTLIERGYSELEELTGQIGTRPDFEQDCPNVVERMEMLNQDLCRLKEKYEHIRSCSVEPADQRTPTMPTKVSKNPSQP
ncbi:Ras GTPase-activating protein nGAP, partial [Cichlidogyrus casuarinus]